MCSHKMADSMTAADQARLALTEAEVVLERTRGAERMAIEKALDHIRSALEKLPPPQSH